MTDILWPGDERAGRVFAQEAVLGAMVRVEDAWLGVLVDAGLAPAAAAADLAALVGDDDLAAVATRAEGGGNPVIPLVALLRERLRERASDAPATWLHRGLTSQDVLDTALALCLVEVTNEVERLVAAQAVALARLADEHRPTLMAGRTLTQFAVPITFGAKAAGWLDGLRLATRQLRVVTEELPAYVGGAAGTLSAVVELAQDSDDPTATTIAAARTLADRVGLHGIEPWHQHRAHLTQTADALVGLGDVWGRIAGDVATLGRPEIGELAEPAVEGRGGSSTMPQKANPVFSILIRRYAQSAPQLAATLHTAAAAYVDERPDGAWHAEWATLATLGRRSVVAASQAAELLDGLQVDATRMRTTATAAADDLHAEQRSIAALAGHEPTGDYLGAADTLIDAALLRARGFWKDIP